MQKTKRVQMGHLDFFHLADCVRANVDGLAKTTSWDEALGFVTGKLRESSKTIAVSKDALRRICDELKVTPDFKSRTRRQSSRRHADEIDILARALFNLYSRLEGTVPVGVQRLYDIACKRPNQAANDNQLNVVG